MFDPIEILINVIVIFVVACVTFVVGLSILRLIGWSFT